MALESLFLRLETFPAPLWIPETHTQLLRPSQSQSEVVIYSQKFQKTATEPEKSTIFWQKKCSGAKITGPICLKFWI